MLNLAKILLLFIIFNACSPAMENIFPEQNTDQIFEELPWLATIRTQLIESKTPSKIIQYSYKNQLVYWVDSCNGCADNLIQVYNPKGEVICQFGGIAGLNTCIDFDGKAKNPKVLFDSTI